MGIAENIKKLRTQSDWTQEQLAAKIGVTRSTVTQWETGWSQPRMGAVEKLAAVFGLSVSEFVSDIPLMKKTVSEDDAWVPIRIVGSVHAGEPDEGFDGDGSVPIPRSVHDGHDGCFALTVRGNCMDLVFGSGSVLIVDPRMEPRDGSICVFLVDGEVVVRRLRKGSSTVMLSPESSEPEHEDIVVSADEFSRFECQGVVFWYQAVRMMD